VIKALLQAVELSPFQSQEQTGFEFYARNRIPTTSPVTPSFFDRGEPSDARYWQSSGGFVLDKGGAQEVAIPQTRRHLRMVRKLSKDRSKFREAPPDLVCDAGASVCDVRNAARAHADLSVKNSNRAFGIRRSANGPSLIHIDPLTTLDELTRGP